MLTVGLDLGSTTIKASVMANGAVCWQDYRRHDTKQAEMTLESWSAWSPSAASRRDVTGSS